MLLNAPKLHKEGRGRANKFNPTVFMGVICVSINPTVGNIVGLGIVGLTSQCKNHPTMSCSTNVDLTM